MDEVTVDQLESERGEKDLLLDVREVNEYVDAHVPGAVLCPLAHVPAAIEQLPREGRIYVICASGNRSRVATEVLVAQGFDAVNVAGGTREWVMSGRPYDQGRD